MQDIFQSHKVVSVNRAIPDIKASKLYTSPSILHLREIISEGQQDVRGMSNVLVIQAASVEYC